MTIVAHGIPFVQPLLAFVALARTAESPWRMSEAIVFNMALYLIFGVATLAILVFVTP